MSGEIEGERFGGGVEPRYRFRPYDGLAKYQTYAPVECRFGSLRRRDARRARSGLFRLRKLRIVG